MGYRALLAASAKADEARQLRIPAGVPFHQRDPADLERGIELAREADRELWFAAQAMMSAVANVHKLLWGNQKARDVAARAPIREALGITDESPISTDARRMRNNFDHYDDRIGAWVESGEGLRIRGTGGAPKIVGHTIKAQWERYDPSTNTLSFWGESISLAAIAGEAQRLIPIADEIEARCAGCMDQGKDHPVLFPQAPSYPSGTR